ncbi:5-oxoprolinase subunit PxpB [Actinoplanes sp. NBRC 103695]|uniref:5-oxoprolinase subunit PxpB n=1 Tax=Actinoplanes sp. NBRC 103695 TaxID=3032202 RepID=UPI00249FFE96|nr:5-oxoprolinase subunit PxpB [Actinoplanes sp. NBRC 103695]GLZ01970.1 allophanate hydrolase [Actinoplanes sp. NBRC 103695]
MSTRFLRCGREAVLVEVADLAAAMALYAALRDASLPGVVDLVPAARTVLIRLDPSVTSPALVRTLVSSVPVADGRPVDAGTVTIPVHYDGPDLADVAALVGVSAEEVVKMHTAGEWTVAFTGFAPGFGYLIGGDPRLSVPRRSSPRTRIPAGSVALAGPYSGVYPNESPGGWQLIGQTSLRIWDLDRDPPALLLPGVRVRFEAVN